MAANPSLAEIAQREVYGSRFRFVQAGSLVTDIKPLPYLIKSIIEADVLASLVAPPETGKSFIALHWAVCVALGLEWMGHRTKQGAVLYLAGEGHAGMSMRLRGLELSLGVSLADAPLYVSNKAVPLNAMEGAAAVLEAIEEVPETPALIVIDTLARNFAGDENSTKDMGAFIAAVDELRQGASALIVHHTGWGSAERGRGSSALFGAVDREWIARNEAGVIVLHCGKAKDYRKAADIGLRLESVSLGVFDEDGDEMTTAVLRPADLPDTRANGLGGNQAKAMKALRILYKDARARLSKQGRNPDEALISLDAWRLAADMQRNRFGEAKTALRDRGLIELPDKLHARIASEAA